MSRRRAASAGLSPCSKAPDGCSCSCKGAEVEVLAWVMEASLLRASLEVGVQRRVWQQLGVAVCPLQPACASVTAAVASGAAKAGALAKGLVGLTAAAARLSWCSLSEEARVLQPMLLHVVVQLAVLLRQW